MIKQLFSNIARFRGRKWILAVSIIAVMFILTYVTITMHHIMKLHPSLAVYRSLIKRKIFSQLQTSAVPTQHTETYPSSPQSDSHSQGLKCHGYKSNEAFKIPYMGNYNCSDAMCTEFLSPHHSYRCKLVNRHHPPLVCLKGSCHFMNGTNRAPVALVGFPGSGNTWVRGLLQQATGICTGALYCDYNLRHSGFNGEGYRNGAVIAVKTHSRSWSDYVYSTTRTTTNSDTININHIPNNSNTTNSSDTNIATSNATLIIATSYNTNSTSNNTNPSATNISSPRTTNITATTIPADAPTSQEIETPTTDYCLNRTKKYHHAKWVQIEDGPPWGSAILILRNPRDALVAEWSRRLTSIRTYLKRTHVKQFGSKYFGDKIEWEEFIKMFIKVWESYFDGWVLSGIKRDLLVVKYEDLKKDTINEVERMLMFLKVPFSREDLKKRLLEDFELFHRPHPKKFEHFTPEQEKHVRERVESVVALLKRENNGDTLGVEEYLEPSV